VGETVPELRGPHHDSRVPEQSRFAAGIPFSTLMLYYIIYNIIIMNGRHHRVSRSLCRFYSAFALATALAATGCGGGDVRGVPVAADSQCPGDGCAAVRCPIRDRDDACPLGLVPDACACCPYGVCGLGEAAACNAADRPCADNLECVKKVYNC